jgi:hypothetical protein
MGCVRLLKGLGIGGRGTFLPITPRQAMEGIVAIAGCEVECC